MEERELIYLAGYFDADGCINAEVDTRNPKVVSAKATIGGRDRDLLITLRAAFGGNISKAKQVAAWGATTVCWRWTVQGKKAGIFIRAILPYLRYKRKQAEAALRIIETIGKPGYRISEEICMVRWENALRITALNQSNMTSPRKTRTTTLIEGLLRA